MITGFLNIRYPMKMKIYLLAVALYLLNCITLLKASTIGDSIEVKGSVLKLTQSEVLFQYNNQKFLIPRNKIDEHILKENNLIDGFFQVDDLVKYLQLEGNKK